MWRCGKKFVALTIIGLTALALLWRSQEIAVAGHTGRVGPAFWPMLALIGILIGTAIKCVEMVLQHRYAGTTVTEGNDGAVNVGRALIAIITVIAAVGFIELTGFVIANFLFLLVFLQVTGLRSKVRGLFVAAAGSIGMVYVFVKLVYVPLPRGIGVFEDATIVVYRLLGIF